MKITRLTALIFMLSLANWNQVLAQSKTVFVNAAATGANDGTSWLDAFTDLWDGLQASNSGDSIFVANGVYTINAGGSFSVRSGVKIFGSFQGTESSLSERNLFAGDTSILRGNNYNVLVAYNVDSQACVDGFKITGGFTHSGGGIRLSNSFLTLSNLVITNNYGEHGGGIHMSQSSPVCSNLKILNNRCGKLGAGIMITDESAPIFKVVIVENNRALSDATGAGIYIESNSRPVFDGVTITDNYGGNVGAGIYHTNANSVFKNSIITSNTTQQGAGIANYGDSTSSLTLINCAVTNNVGGGILNHGVINLTNVTIAGNGATSDFSIGGGINNTGRAQLTNVLIHGNSADSSNGLGGGLYTNGGEIILSNVTIAGNKAVEGGGIYKTDSAILKVFNSISYGNSSEQLSNTNDGLIIKNSLVQGYTDSLNGNIKGEGILVDDIFTGPKQPGLSTGGYYELNLCSPVVNRGDINLLDSTNITDLAGNARVFGAGVDLGAFESQKQAITSKVIYVDASANGNNTGTSWTNALTSLGEALGNAKCYGADSILVADGTYHPDRRMDYQRVISSDSIERSFVLVPNVKLIGGYPAGGGVRNITELNTILDGGGYAAHVLVSAGNVGTAEVNGFKIINGGSNKELNTIVNGYQVYDCSGGGMYASVSSPMLKNLLFENNDVGESGGGYFGYQSSPLIENVVFKNNKALNGGGVANQYRSSPTLINVVIENNNAKYNGGGVYSIDTCDIVFDRVMIRDNEANIGGGVANEDLSTPTFKNVLIAENRASFMAGGMFNSNNTVATLMNVTIAGNITLGDSVGVGIYNDLSSYTKSTNTIVFGNGGVNVVTLPDSTSQTSFAYSLVEGVSDSTNGNISADSILYATIFVNPLDSTHASTENGDYSLKDGSPAINKGTNTNAPLVDLIGTTRPSKGVVDLGAYEYKFCEIPLITIDRENGVTVVASVAGENFTYQWINCETNSSMPNDTTKRFVATENGQYAVIVSNGICSDTSDCVVINQVGLKHDLTKQMNAVVYPNPSYGTITVLFQSTQPATVQLVDVSGKVIKMFEQVHNNDSISIEEVGAGMYFLMIQTPNGVAAQRVVKY
jgi:hypothetical protein